jgi:hypothetical protein
MLTSAVGRSPQRDPTHCTRQDDQHAVSDTTNAEGGGHDRNSGGIATLGSAGVSGKEPKRSHRAIDPEKTARQGI